MEGANMNGTNKELFLNNKTVEDYVKDIMMSVRGCQKLSGELAGWHHYRDYTGVERTMTQVNDRLTSLLSGIFKHQDILITLGRHKLLDQFDMMKEGNDALLERVNSDVDEASGLKKNADAELLEPAELKKVEGPTSSASGRSVVLLASRTVQKPQLFFSKKVDNSHKTPFLPLLEEKPNNKKPISILLCIDEKGRDFYSHPYEYELQHWEPLPSQLKNVTPKLPNPISETPIVMVETEEDLAKMVAELKECTEFGFDIEHHSYRTYQGLTCLLQISTREMDYIVDPLPLRGKLTILNEVFTDPKITKVAHGADYDILWLQRDCGVYVVNLFDTHQAAIVLSYPHRSLAALLSRFCRIEANKVYQRADWRIRPLPEDFINYARQDSHNLLYIFDLMSNELIEKGNDVNNLITAVYTRSSEICMKRYEKPIVHPDSHMDIYRRSRKTFNSRQIFALQALYLWRDRVAREQDESTEYVLPKHMLLQIAEVLPKEMQGVLACCNPIPPLVKTELLTLHTLIREARQQKLRELLPSAMESQLPYNANQTLDDAGTGIISKHDLSQCDENPTDLPVLLNPGENLLGDLFVHHKISIAFKKVSQNFGCMKNALYQKLKSHFEISQQFISPYERYTTYLEMKPVLEGEKKKGVDQDRIKRIMDHFITLTTNTQEERETETDARFQRAHQDDIDQEALQNRSRQPATVVVPKEEEVQEMAKSFERQVTHQAIDSFLESARKGTEVNKVSNVDKLLSHFRQVGSENTGISSVIANSDEDSSPAEAPKKKAKKKNKKVLLENEVKKKKGKSKGAKRGSTNTLEESPSEKKMKTDNVEEVEKTEEISSKEKEESLEEGEISPTNSAGEDKESAAFDYEAADYSIFQKVSRKKSFKDKQNKERFKGKAFQKLKKSKGALKI